MREYVAFLRDIRMLELERPLPPLLQLTFQRALVTGTMNAAQTEQQQQQHAARSLSYGGFLLLVVELAALLRRAPAITDCDHAVTYTEYAREEQEVEERWQRWNETEAAYLTEESNYAEYLRQQERKEDSFLEGGRNKNNAGFKGAGAFVSAQTDDVSTDITMIPANQLQVAVEELIECHIFYYIDIES